MEERNHFLLAAENFLGVELTSPDQVNSIFDKLSVEQISELIEQYKIHVAAWQPEASDNKPAMHLGRAHVSIGKPTSWLPRYRSAHCTIDVEYISKLLIYVPKVTAWLPEFHGPIYSIDKTANDICQVLCKLSELRDFLADGSLQIVPDRFYADVCNWSGTEKPSPMLLLAREEAKKADYRNILDRIDFYAGAEEQCSDSTYIWAANESESIRYTNPINEINEDVVVQSLIGASTICADANMYDLMEIKYASEALHTQEMVWSKLSTLLPKVRLPVADLQAVRKNEDAFNTWRASLSRAIRETERCLERRGTAEQQFADIFKEQLQPESMILGEKIKSNTLRKSLENGVVAFGCGAIAALSINPDPKIAIMTGAANSSLKVIYDTLKSFSKKN